MPVFQQNFFGMTEPRSERDYFSRYLNPKISRTSATFLQSIFQLMFHYFLGNMEFDCSILRSARRMGYLAREICQSCIIVRIVSINILDFFQKPFSTSSIKVLTNNSFICKTSFNDNVAVETPRIGSLLERWSRIWEMV